LVTAAFLTIEARAQKTGVRPSWRGMRGLSEERWSRAAVVTRVVDRIGTWSLDSGEERKAFVFAFVDDLRGTLFYCRVCT
jgi:hypothetical protein